MNMWILTILALAAIVFFSILYGTDASIGGKAAGMFFGGFLTGCVLGYWFFYGLTSRSVADVVAAAPASTESKTG
jgi:membrane associated rhomboid family serine protease